MHLANRGQSPTIRGSNCNEGAAVTLNIDWHDYNLLVERLALNVYESGFRFNQIICIARGGLRVGDVLSRIFDQPLAILSTHSYTAEGGTIRGELVIAEHMTMTKPRLGDRVLLVDDMVDSGHTLEAVFRELPRRFPHIAELRTAVLWWKACSVFKPDYFVDYLADSPWIHQPFEVYDDLDPATLTARVVANERADPERSRARTPESESER
jgi:hypoxanthine phosphoribosyltransferase